MFALLLCAALAAGCALPVEIGGWPGKRQRGKNPFAHLTLGIALEESGDLEGAAAQYQKAAEEDPASPTIAARLGTALHRLGQTEQAAPYLAAAENAAPERPDLALLLADFFRDAGRTKNALTMCSLAEADPALRTEAQWIRARALFESGSFAAAEKTLTPLAAKTGEDRFWLLLGRSFEAQGESQNAADAYCRAAHTNPEAAVRAATVYALEGNFTRAADIARRHLAVIPPATDVSAVPYELPPSPRSDIKPWNWRPGGGPRDLQRGVFIMTAWVALSRRSHPAALAAVRASIDETGQYWQAFEFLGDISLDSGERPAALEHYRRARETAPAGEAKIRLQKKISALEQPCVPTPKERTGKADSSPV